MKKSLKILFPTDFSESSEKAFDYVLVLADRLGASIELLHVVYPITGGGFDTPVLVSQVTTEMQEIGRKLMMRFKNKGIEKVKNHMSEIPDIITNVEVGRVVMHINRVIEKDQIDLVMMSSRGMKKSGIEKYFGSIAKDVVAQSPVPVLLIPEYSKFEAPLKLAYATDLQEADPFEIWQSVHLLKPLCPLVHVVHVNFGEEGMEVWNKMEEMKAFFKSKDFSEVFFHHIPGSDLQESLNDFVLKEGIDMLVMYQQKRGVWSRLFHRSQTKEMTLNTKVPLLIQKS